MTLKKLTMTIHIQPREPGPLSSDERKQLADFFEALMDLRPSEYKDEMKSFGIALQNVMEENKLVVEKLAKN